MSERFDDETLATWHEWLADFKARMVPVFAEYGFSADAALVAFSVNRVYNTLDSDPDEGAPWRESR
jgi:hypothetical protein